MKRTHAIWLCAAVVLLAACGDPAEPAPQIDSDGGLEDVPSPEPDTTPEADAEDPQPDASVIRIRYEPDGAGFYRLPWPSDGRLTEAGTPDLGDYPEREGVVETVLTELETSVAGYATMPVMFVGLEGPVSNAALVEPLESLEADSPIQLINLSESGCGERVALDMIFTVREEAPFADANLLRAKNSIGTILDPGSPYALVILKSFGAPESRTTERPAAFDAALGGDGSTHAASLEPLRRCLPQIGMALDDVAAATVFTPQDPVVEMRVLRDHVMDPEKVETRGLVSWERSDPWSRKGLRLTTWTGFVEMPIFQRGALPYSAEGSGGLAFDEAGQPVIQRWEEVEIAVQMRDFEEPPEGPRPVLVFIDGTGWSPWTQLYGNWVNDALNAGFIVASFMPQFHGNRGGFGGSPEISTFNFVNPAAGRSNFRQQAAETSYFVRLLREQIAGQPGLPELDTDNIVYGGHSQGALCGAITASVETEYKAYVFNGLSSYLTLTLLYRKDLIDFQLIVRSIFGLTGNLNEFSPVIQLMQAGAEVVDPHNYVREWRGWETNPRGNHIFVSNGFNDATTTPRGMDHLVMTADMQPIDPPGWDVDPVGLWDGVPVALPIEGNATSLSGDPLTIATYLHPEEGHFTIHRQRFVRELAINFWRTSRTEPVPRLVSTREYQCGDGADDDDDGMIDCDDPNCRETPPCIEGNCEDGLDEDGNGLIDCDDPACAEATNCIENLCGDGLDNDGDGASDCDDPDCDDDIPCAEIECGDGLDDDGDGDIDCDDDQCARSPLCIERNCVDNVDSDRDGMRDCADPDCTNSIACPELVCDDGEDGDNNNLIDCNDPGCAGTEACPINLEAACGDESDDDNDGLTDCEDPDCALDPACADEGRCADGDLGSQLGIPVFVGNLDDADDDYFAGDCVGLGSGGGSKDASFLWTPPTTGRFVISTYGTDYDTAISIYPADCDRERELACDDDEGPVLTSRLTIDVTEINPLVIVVSGYDEEDTGPFQLHIFPR